MEIRETDKQKYPRLNLHELFVIVKDFLIDYPFVSAMHLCRGRRGERRYNLLFEVLCVPIEMKTAYLRFRADIDDVPALFLNFEDVYRDRKESVKAGDEWKCCEVQDAADIEGEGLHDFVVPNDFVCLYVREASSSSNQANKGARMEVGAFRRWVYGQELQDRWDINMTEFLNLVWDGDLTPCDPDTLLPLDIRTERAALSFSVWPRPKLNDRFVRLVFKWEDIEACAKKFGLPSLHQPVCSRANLPQSHVTQSNLTSQNQRRRKFGMIRRHLP